jgi:hypothetical protein
MKLHISKGNIKLGKIPNISLPPVVTCRPKTPCAKMCYANKAMRLYPSARRAWQENLEFLMSRGHDAYFSEIEQWLDKESPEYFRWHVSGDCPDEKYIVWLYSIALTFPGTQFMMFTKRWDLLHSAEKLPGNFSVVLSMWPGLANPKKFELPRAWLSTDKRKPEFHFKCPGKCDGCYACWDILRFGYDVVFDPH